MSEKEIRASFQAALERLLQSKQGPDWCEEHGAVFSSGKGGEFIVVIAVKKASDVILKKVVESRSEVCPEASIKVEVDNDENMN